MSTIQTDGDSLAMWAIKLDMPIHTGGKVINHSHRAKVSTSPGHTFITSSKRHTNSLGILFDSLVYS